MSKALFEHREACPACRNDLVAEVYRLAYSSPVMRNYLDAFYGPQGRGVDHDFLKDANFLLNQCRNCSTVFQAEVPGDSLMGKLYGEWIDPELALERARSYDARFYFDYANEMMLLLTYFQRKPIDLRFLDFGMGWGKWCLMAKAFGCNVAGVELSEHRKQYAEAQSIEVIEYDQLDGRRFDFINTEQVLEHISSPLDTLEKLTSTLKLNGVIKVSVPNGNRFDSLLADMDWNAEKGSFGSVNIVAPLEHINCFTFDAVVKMGALCGLEIIEELTYVRYSVSARHGMRQNLKNIYENYFRKDFEPCVYFKKR